MIKQSDPKPRTGVSFPLDRYREFVYCTGIALYRYSREMRTMEMATAMVLAMNNMATEAYSARPDSPVVPYEPRTPWNHAVRTALAAGLSRAARAVEPAQRCSPA
jgi:hypothetical protein